MSEIYDDLGQQLREIRVQKGITINDLAKETDFTPSFISQLERGRTKGSLAAVHKLTNALGVKVSALFARLEETTGHTQKGVQVIRKNKQRQVHYPDGRTVDFLLSDPSSTPLHVFYTEVEPGGESGEMYFSYNEYECITIVEGSLEMTFEEEVYELHEGDTVHFTSQTPRSWKNTTSEKVKVFWVITSPTT